MGTIVHDLESPDPTYVVEDESFHSPIMKCVPPNSAASVAVFSITVFSSLPCIVSAPSGAAPAFFSAPKSPSPTCTAAGVICFVAARVEYGAHAIDFAPLPHASNAMNNTPAASFPS